jgi:biotin carboxyl carrier protein
MSAEDGMTGVSVADDVVSVPASVLERYRRYTAYNSPYAAHDHGCAVDLYPDGDAVPSPVAGEVIATETVRAPPKPYAPAGDHLVVVDCGPVVARIMHVNPTVEVGETVSPGQDLGDLVRAGFFARWVGTHLHVGFRRHDQNHLRAGGSLALSLGVDPTPVDWDGTGTVVDAGETYAVLDAPDLDDVADGAFAGLAATVGGDHVVLDGGFQHYDGGGVHADATGPVELLGETVGDAVASPGSTNDVTWRPVEVRANAESVHGVSLFCGRDGDYAVKLVGETVDLVDGERVALELEPVA